ncbi:flavin-containing monooxygenase [Alteromonas oceanisediminis]|uniref:flavin-containing monooxygenase n=1 Tax=Alteromonas oceanisediminis TaxID=2836180 RepID=UPI001BDA073E|nr:NAD(P)/FAD-dependent oxidoreductase [Alteromonas oceanisediminis]MBT0586261.1 NAD(P)/FAD-dependent oxidoreductase [Alteromonas oceanisediminis]
MPDKHAKKAIILGAGLGGLAAAIQLKKAGISVHIVERNPSVGGTWYQNTYPGCACDVQVALYQFSFAQSLNWTRLYPQASELLAYAKELVDTFQLHDNLTLNTEAKHAKWCSQSHQWQVECDNGLTLQADYLICALGQLNRPAFPDIPGRADFTGQHVHSAAWDHSVDFTDKRVGLIGTGASAVQVAPELAKVAKHLTVFQRSANWIRGRGDRAISENERRLKATNPEQANKLAAHYRTMLYEESDYYLWQAFEFTELGRTTFTEDALAHLHAQVPDPALRAKLTPDYPIGCKRILCSDDYYPTLMRENVSLEDKAIDRITPRGIKTDTEHALDIIVYATGFETTGWKWSVDVIGLNGSLHAQWLNKAQAYNGTMVSGFPNMFVLYGPNTNVGHSSITFMLEQQINFMLRVIDSFSGDHENAVMPTESAQSAFNQSLQAKLSKTVWADNACSSWYKTADGTITQNWASHTRDFASLLSTVERDDFQVIA